MKKILIILIILIIITAGIAFWLFTADTPTETNTDDTEPTLVQRFNPFNRSTVKTDEPIIKKATTTKEEVPVENIVEMPILRRISQEPVAGYMASSTVDSTIVRYIDRGTGHIYEAKSDRESVEKISNTTIARVYEGYWNKNLDATILRYIKEGTDIVTNLYGKIEVSTNTGSTTDRTPYQTKGRIISSSIKEVAVSPKGDRIFTFNLEDGTGIGYVSGFDESKKTKIWNTPITQVNISWPEENTLMATTKSSGYSYGYSYFIDIKTGMVKKMLGQIIGLSAKASPDAKNILFSAGSNAKNISSFIYNVKNNSSQSIIFKTLADKCVWSKLRVNEIYCAVPVEFPEGVYPDDWYKGNISFIDKIWYLNTDTGEVHLLADLLTLSKSLIDVTDIGLDTKEDFLYFINKNDLNLWSLDLNR